MENKIVFEGKKECVDDERICNSEISEQLKNDRGLSNAIMTNCATIEPMRNALKSFTDTTTLKDMTDNISCVKSIAMFEDTALNAIKEANLSVNVLSSATDVVKRLSDNSTIRAMGELAIEDNHPIFTYNNHLFEEISVSTRGVARTFNENISKIFSESKISVVDILGTSIIPAIKSPAIDWLHNIDMSPMRTMLAGLLDGFDKLKFYNEFEKLYLTAMYECKWFPYAGYVADFSLAAEVAQIISTSRGASKRREKRIDSAILNYYTPKEIRNIKKTWKSIDLESHIKKILGQAIAAHLRGEYVLTITCLATMWEGLIHHKLHIDGRYSQKKTKLDFIKLVDENEYDEIFSDFYDNLIVSQCDTIDEVVDGIPNRNGVSHSKYKKYPNKKASINAILLTDFIIHLKPI